MFVTRLDQKGSPDASVTLYNVSSGGVAFLSDTTFPPGALLGIKLFWSDPDAARVPAIVRHTYPRSKGILVGAEFVLDDPRVFELIYQRNGRWYG